MPRKYFPTAFDNIVGPFNFDAAQGKWIGPTGKICDEISNYFSVPAGTTSFSIEATTERPTDRPFVEVTVTSGPARQDCLSYNCAQRGSKNFKVQEALRPLANQLFERAGSPSAGLVVFVSMFTTD